MRLQLLLLRRLPLLLPVPWRRLLEQLPLQCSMLLRIPWRALRMMLSCRSPAYAWSQLLSWMVLQ